MKQPIYLDHANATPVRREVLDKMLPILCNLTGCTHGSHRAARKASLIVEEARRTTLSCLGVETGSVSFTAGGSQASESVVLGLARLAGSGHILTTRDEDEGVLAACKILESQGFRVTYLPLDENGCLDPARVEAALEPDTILLSLSGVNRLTGCRQPVEKLADICRSSQLFFHLEWSLSCLYELDLEESGIDVLTLSSHLIRGPQGAGAVWAREGLAFSCLETDNLPGIVGFTQALCLFCDERSDWLASLQGLRNEFLLLLEAALPEAIVPPTTEFHPAIVSIDFEGVNSCELVYQLDRWGICAGETPYGVRLSFGRTTTAQELREAVQALASSVRTCRQRLRDAA